MRSIKFLVVAALAGLLVLSAPSHGAESLELGLGESVSWAGEAPDVLAGPPAAAAELCAPEAEGVLCTSQTLTAADAGQVLVRIDSAGPNDWDVFVFDADGELIAQGFEVAEFPAVAEETYRVAVRPRLVLPKASFLGSASMVALPAS